MADEEVLDRDVVDRILRRANEITTARSAPADPSAGVSAAALLAAAEEVGLPLAAVRRSIAIEQLGEPPASRRGDRILGRRVVFVDDDVAGSPQIVLEQLDAWLVDGHHLRRDRLRAGAAEWSKRPGSVNAVMRSVRSTTGTAPLGQFERISARAVDAGDGSAVVRIAVDRTSGRRAVAGGGTAMAVGGSAALAVGAVAATPFLLLGTPVFIAAGVGIAVTGRRHAAMAQREIERVLESVNDGAAPSKLRNDLVKRVAGGRQTRDIKRGAHDVPHTPFSGVPLTQAPAHPAPDPARHDAPPPPPAHDVGPPPRLPGPRPAPGLPTAPGHAGIPAPPLAPLPPRMRRRRR